MLELNSVRSATHSHQASSKTLYQSIKESAVQYSNNLSVFDSNTNKNYTYQNLATESDLLARYLVDSITLSSGEKLTHHTGNLIGILSEKGYNQVVAALSIMQSGHGYLPLSIDWPINRIDEVLQQGNVRYLLLSAEQFAQTSLQKTLAARYELIVIEDLLLKLTTDKAIQARLSTITLPQVQPDDIAYVIFTSGSTGKPKGVTISHRGALNTIIAVNERFKVNNQDKVLALSELSFDLSVYDIFGLLMAGGTIVFPKQSNVKDSYHWVDLINKHGVTLWNTVPQLADLLADEWEHAPKSSSTLRVFLLSGDRIPLSLPDRLKTLCPKAIVMSLGGATEGSIWSIWHEIEKVEPDWQTIPYGVAMPNQAMHVLTEAGEPCPIGVAGEICIGGVGVALNYWNDNEKTNERYFVHPNLGRLYRTGDLGKWSAQGYIEFIGRKDNQVKIRGHRVELGEIEAQVVQVQNVKSAVVVASDGDKNHLNQFLVLYYVLTEGISPEEAKSKPLKLKKILESNLPYYMVPDFIIPLAELPLTNNGKVDRKLLQNRIISKHENYSAPNNELEESLCYLWSDILGIEKNRISIHDEFFRLGGDSISSIRLISRIRNQYNCEMSVKNIFDLKTIERLAKYLQKMIHEVTFSSKNEQGILTGNFGLLPVQQWFFDNQFPNPSHYNQLFYIKVPKLDINRLKKSISKLIEYHDAFRLSFKLQNNNVVYEQEYKIANEIDSHFFTLNINKLSTNEQSPHFIDDLNKQLSMYEKTIDLFKGRPYSVGYIDGFADGSARIYFAIHHLCVDTVSWRILANDLEQIYNNRPLSDKGSSYRQWVEAVNQYGQSHLTQKEYWLKLLAEYNDQAITHLKSSANHPIEREFILDKNETESLLQLSNQAYNTEINDLLLTALAYALSAITNNNVNHIALEGHGREAIDPAIDISGTMGWFTTLFPVRLAVGDDLSSSIITIKETLKAIPDKGVGFGVLMGYKDYPLPKISFNYLGQFDNDKMADINDRWSITNEGKVLSTCGSNSSHYLATITGITINGRASFKIESYLQDAATSKMFQHFEKYLKEIIKHTSDKETSCLTISDVNYLITQDELNEIQKDKEIKNVYLANSLQQGFIYHALAQGHADDAYRVQFCWNYNTKIDMNLLRIAWEVMLKRYDALRLRFSWNNKLLQIIDKNAELDWRYLDLSNRCKEDQEVELDKIQQKDRSEIYQLQQGKLFRVYLIKLNENKYNCLFSIHHAILDGWSCMIILNELHRIFTDLVAGKSISSQLDYAYGDAQRYIQQHDNDNEIFWKQELAKYNPQNGLSHLVTIHNGEVIDTKLYRHIVVPKTKLRSISGEMFSHLKRLCREYDFTLNALLNFIWHHVLHIYTSDDQTIVGITVSGRNLPITDIEHSIGLYINTLPLMIDHEQYWDMRLIDVVRSIQEKINQLNAACVTKLTTLQQDGRRLFDCLYAYNNFAVNIDKSIKDALGITLGIPVEKLDYPLALNIDESPENIELMIKYAGELFNDDLIDGFFDTVNGLLKQVLQDPLKKVSTFSYCPEKPAMTEDQQISAPSLTSVFESIVHQFPDKIALDCEATQITYQELNEQANCLANYLLHNCKLKTENLVLICVDQPIARMIAILGVIKAGGAYVPVSESMPNERLSYYLKDTKASFILTTQSQKDKFSALTTDALSVLMLDDSTTQKQISQSSNINPQLNLAGHHLAYVMYTSGTTGEPKGVLIAHQGITSLVCTVDYIKIDKTDVFVQLSDVSFDASTFEIWGALLNGARLVLIKDRLNILGDVASLRSFIKEHRISILWQTKSLFDQMFTLDPDLYNDLKYLIVGGEALNKTLMLKLLSSRHHPAHILNGYGPTENTTFSCVYELDLTEINRYQTIPLGKPLVNRQAYVLSKSLKLLPTGAVGELYVGGSGLARGYLNRDKLTIERFIVSPFHNKTNYVEKIYKTGDWVKRLDDNILYLGRRDGQVKIRGYRIELEEVEKVILSIPGVAKCAVIFKVDDNQHSQLAAYFQAEMSLDEDKLRSYLIKLCPDYMIPSFFIKVDAFPLTPNGKIDKHALLTLKAASKQILIKPCNNVQDKILEIWSAVLGIEKDKIGINDNFFTIGGDSILSIQLVSKLKQAFEKNIRINDIFRLNTLSALTEYFSPTETKVITSVNSIQSSKSETLDKIKHVWSSVLGIDVAKINNEDNFFVIGGDSILSIQLVSKLKQAFDKNIRLNDIFRLNTINALTEYFLTEKPIVKKTDAKNEIDNETTQLLPIQKWFFSLSLPNPHYWNQSFLIKTPPLDIDRLKQCLELLISHHDVFRAYYQTSTNNQHDYIQRYHAEIKKPALIILPCPEKLEELSHYYTEWQSHFDINKGPLYQIAYIHGFPDGSSRIYMAFHHLIIDTVSWRILVEDLEHIYNGKTLKTVHNQFKSWIKVVNDYAITHSTERQYWAEVLTDYNEKVFSDMLANTDDVYTSECHLEVEETDQLLRVSNEAYNTKINDLLLTALAYTLTELTNDQVSHIVLEGHGREDLDPTIDINHTVGWFTTMYPVRLEVSNDLSKTIKNIKENLRNIPNNGIGYGSLIGYQEEHLPKIGFNYLGQLDNQSQSQWKITNEKAGQYKDQKNKLSLVIDIYGFVIDKKLFFNIQTKLHSPYIDKLTHSFINHLRKIIEHCVHKDYKEYTDSDFTHIESEKDIPLLPALPAYRASGWFEMTDIQKAYLLGRLANYEIGNISNHIYYEFYYRELDVKKLNSALSQLINCYPVLRTVYSFETLKQKFLSIDEIKPYEIQTRDYSQLNHSQDIINQVRSDLSHKVYDPTQFPLFHFVATHFKDCTILHVSIDLILLDAESRRMLFSLLTKLYNEDKTLLNNTVTSFKDYQEYYQMLRKSSWYRRDKSYWEHKVRQMPLRPELPLLVAPQTIKQPAFSDHTLYVAAPIWAKFKTKLIEQGISTASALLAIYGSVIAFYSGFREFIITMTLFNRYPLCKDAGEILGDFTSTNLFHFINHGDDIYRTISVTHHALWEDINHALYTGVEVQRDLVKMHGLDENKAVSPIVFTGVFGNKQQSDDHYIDNSEIKDKRYWCGQTSQAWIDLQAIETNNQLMSKWIYVDQLFDIKYINELNTLFCDIICSIADHSWGSIKPIFRLPEEQSAFITRFNNVKQTLPETTIVTQITQSLATYQHNNAVIDTGTNHTYTYQHIATASDLLARYLVDSITLSSGEKLTHHTGNLIGILSEKGYNQVVAALSIMQSGHGYLPLSIDWPINRIDEVLQQGNVRYLLLSAEQFAQTSLQKTLAARYELIVIEDLLLKLTTDKAIQARLSTITLPQVQPDDIAYVIFTSGSTGKPKGVTISHRGALNTIIAVNERFKVNNQDKVLALSELSFDLSVYDIFGLLMAGGTIVFPKQSNVKDSYHWVDLINKHGVTLWNTVPQLADLLADEWEHAPKSSSTLRVFLLSGDRIPLSLPDRLKTLCPKAIVMSLGGATEGSIWSIWHEIEKVEPDWQTIPYGVAMPNQAMHVLTEAGEPCPIGVAGEICIGGVGVALNYWNDNEKTNESYFVHPSLDRLYRTGDLGKWSAQGYIEFIGRKDNQVKIRGYRVELEEIEKKLLTLLGIKQAIVNVVGNTELTKMLVAYIITELDFTDQKQADNEHIVQFKLSQNGNRDFDNSYKTYALSKPTDLHFNNYAYLRKSYRQFINRQIISDDVANVIEIQSSSSSESKVTITILSEILSAFYGHQKDAGLPKYGYPSAGSLYPVQVYFRINPDLITGLEGGYYYYDRRTHGLVYLSASETFEDSINIYFVAKKSAITPIYKDKSEEFYALEAGYMHALLNEVTAKYSLAWQSSLKQQELYSQLQLDTNDYDLLSHLVLTNGLRAAEIDVDIYFHVRPGAFADLTGIWYQYNHGELNEKPWPALSTINHLEDNALIWRQSLFAVYLVSKTSSFSRDSLMNSGYLSHVIVNNLLNKSLGSCPIGEIDKAHQATLRQIFDDKPILHHFIVGAVTSEQLADKNISVINRIDTLKKCIINELRRLIPEYMLPSEIAFFEKFPLTPNGKVDLKELLLLTNSNNKVITLVKPRNQFEITLCHLWSEILNLDSVGIKDNFFRLGGNSLLAMQLVSQINKQLNTKLELKDIYELGSIERISDHCHLSMELNLERESGQL